MSAFLCERRHFVTIAAWATSAGSRQRLSPQCLARILGLDANQLCRANYSERATTVALALRDENIRSMVSRYGAEKAANPPAFPKLTAAETMSHVQLGREVSPVQILKMLDCLEYQSCESADYYQTPAYDLLQWLRKAAIHELDGYEDADWELCV